MSEGAARARGRWFLAGGLAVGVLVLVVAGILATILVTERGARWTLGFLARQGVQVESVQGRLLGPLELRGISYRSPKLDLDVAGMELAWRPRSLRGRTVEVHRLALREVVVTVREGEESPADEAPGPPEFPELALPLGFLVREIVVTDLSVHGLGEEAVEVREISGSVEGRGSAVVLRRLEVAGEGFDLRASGQVELAGEGPLELDFDWHGALPDGPALAGRGTLGGTASALRVEHHLLAPAPVEIHGAVAGLPRTPEWEARVRMSRADLDLVFPDGPLRWASVDAGARGTGTDGTLRGEFAAGGDFLREIEGSLEAELLDRVLRLERLQARGEVGEASVTLDGSGTVHLEEEPRGELRVSWSARLPGRPSLAGGGHLSGGAASARLEHRLTAPVEVTLLASGEELLDDPRWAAEVTARAVYLSALEPELPDHRISLAMAASGEGAALRGRVDLEARLAEAREEAPPVTAELLFRSDARARRALLEVLTLTPPGGGVVRARAELDHSGEVPEFVATGEWESLDWAGGKLPPIQSRWGRFAAAGRPGSFRTSVDGALSAGDRVDGAVLLRGGGGLTEYRLDSLTFQAPAGRVAVAGRVSWEGDPAWEGSVEATGVMLSELGPDLVGRVDGEASGVGELTREGLQARWSLPRLTWVDGARRVEARGEGSVNGNLTQIRLLEVRSRANRLEARGSLDEAWDVAWELDAPDLAAGPGLEGRARGRGDIAGPRSRPRVRAELTAGGIQFPGISLDTVDVWASVDVADQNPSRIRIILEGMGGDWPRIGLRAEVQGQLADHRLDGSAWTGTGDSLTVGLAGDLRLPPPVPEVDGPALDGQATGLLWAGSFTGLAVRSPDLGEWALRGPAAFQAAPSSVFLERLCLDGEEAEACVNGRWDDALGGEGVVRIREVDLTRFAHLLPPGLAATGTAFLEAAAILDEEGSLSGSFDAGVQEGRVRYIGPAGVEEVRDLEEMAASAELDPEGMLRGRLAVRLSEGDGVEGRWTAAPVPGGPETRVSGRLSGEFEDRGFMAALSEELWNSQGVLRGSLQLDGTVGEPVLTGEVRLDGGAVEVPELGIRVEGVRFVARDRGPDEWGLEGKARSGRGSVRLEGSAWLPRPGRPGSMALDFRGEDFQAMNSSMARVEISPALRLAGSEERTELTGEVRIPRAELTPGEMDGIVAASPDVTIVGEVEPEDVSAPDPADNLHIRVRLAFGDSVTVNGLGVTGRVAGAVTVVQEPGRLMTGQGEVRLLDGEYVAARQRLTIERGRLVYSDRPLEDPGLDLRIIRRTPEVLAGMDVRGTAREPEITIFSEPDMPEAEAMAYLLIGRPIRGSGEGDGELMDRVITSMGLAGGAALLSRLGPALGVAEARIERGARLSDAALVVGTNFTPRLFVSYGAGIFGGTANVLRLRYQIARNWILRTESARELGADLLYSVER